MISAAAFFYRIAVARYALRAGGQDVRAPLTLAEKPRVPFLIALFPDSDNLIDGYIAHFALVVFQMQNAVLDCGHMPAKTGGGAAKDVNLSSDQCL